ncbi:MAG TPA: 1-deoxy-D-xylulose-5-phosphate reductoisomerase [Burkholderiales bacterium]|nr:1-deoxy-D-xylulose-5-phosphate reductoisomerase [Burkholderiales bacterium]
MRGVTVLGSTGSIGVNTLDVIARHPTRFRVIALSANEQVERLFEQCTQFNPQYAVLPSEEGAERLTRKIRAAGLSTEALVGTDALENVAALPEVDCVMAAIVGAAGLKPTLAAVRAGKTVLLANKESLVMSGALFMQAVKQSGARLLPIDSEHNAIFQALPRNYADGLGSVGVTRILLTASGGPFRNTPPERLQDVTPDQACAHPNWVMGRKISVDSATMMNKGLEVIEAHWLFNAAPDAIEVVVHPQSVIHSMVAFSDGSVIAQLGNPDMRTPIAYGLGFPERIEAGVEPLDLARIARLDFEPLDRKRFPCVDLAYHAMRAGGTSSTILNAANEVAVAAFLDGKLRFTDIAGAIAETMERINMSVVSSLDDVFAADWEARVMAREIVAGQLARI